MLFFIVPSFAQTPAQGEVGYSFTQGELTYTISSTMMGGFSGMDIVSVRAASTSIEGTDGVLTLPSRVTDGGTQYEVFRIEDEGFKDCTNLVSITDGDVATDGIVEVGENAFNGCTNLESILFTAIDGFLVDDDNGDIFEGCSNLTSIGIYIGHIESLLGYTGGREIIPCYYSYSNGSSSRVVLDCCPLYPTVSTVYNELYFNVYDAVNHYAEVDAFYPYIAAWPNYYEGSSLTIPSSVTINGQEYTVKRFATGTNSTFVIDNMVAIGTLNIPNSLDIVLQDMPLASNYVVAADHPSCTTINGSLYSKSSLNKLIRASYHMKTLPTTVDTIGAYAFDRHGFFNIYPADDTLRITHDVKYVEDHAFNWLQSYIGVEENGSLPLLSNYTTKSCWDFIDGMVVIRRQLPVDEFSLVGTVDPGWYAIEFIFKGETTGIKHSAVVLPFYYAGNSWGVDANGAGATTEEFNKGEGYFYYPTSYKNSDGTTFIAGDSYVISDFTTSNPSVDFDLDLTNTNSTKWFALSNPFTGRLNLSKFYETNASALNNTHAYVWDNETEHDWVDWADINTENKYALRPSTGFMVEGAATDVTFHFDDDDQVSTETISINKSTSADRLEFVALSNGIEKKMYAHIDDVSSNGFGRMDASVLCSAKEDAVNPYMAVEGHNLLDNYFSELPATFDVNFNAYKSNTIDFALTQGMEDVEVTLIDLANANAETVLNVNEPVTINVTEGQNEGRYQLRFSKKNVGINAVASEESSIQIWNNASEVTISGKDLKKVEIFNTLGQMVYSSKIAGSSVSFDSGLTNGAYIIKATDSKSTKSEKIIIR